MRNIRHLLTCWPLLLGLLCLPVFARAEVNTATIESYRDRINANLQESNFEEAFRLCEEALALDPKSDSIHVLLQITKSSLDVYVKRQLRLAQLNRISSPCRAVGYFEAVLRYAKDHSEAVREKAMLLPLVEDAIIAPARQEVGDLIAKEYFDEAAAAVRRLSDQCSDRHPVVRELRNNVNNKNRAFQEKQLGDARVLFTEARQSPDPKTNYKRSLAILRGLEKYDFLPIGEIYLYEGLNYCALKDSTHAKSSLEMAGRFNLQLQSEIPRGIPEECRRLLSDILGGEFK